MNIIYPQKKKKKKKRKEHEHLFTSPSFLTETKPAYNHSLKTI